MSRQIPLQGSEIAEGAFGTDELQMHQGAGGVIDKHQQGADRTAIFKSMMVRAVDLDQLAKALPAQTRLVEGLPLLARQPQAPILHPLAQGLARYRQPVTLCQHLGRQDRAEVA